MYTFVFIAETKERPVEGILHSTSLITKKRMPSLGAELTDGYTYLPESNCGWIWLAPVTGQESCPFISEAVESQYAVLAYGEIFEPGCQNPAEMVLKVWKSEGEKKVRELEGCFSAILVDRTNGVITLVGDLIGQRNLRYFTDKQTLVVSPHDIPIVATGVCPVEFDYISACSIAAVQWSLSGKSLLKDIHTCSSAEYIRWSNGKTQIVSDSVIVPSQRIEKRNQRAIANNLDRMIETVQQNVRAMMKDKSEIETTLSAGLDSRAVLSLLLSVKDPSQIVALSSGDPDFLDVQVSREISKLCGIRFIRKEHSTASPDDFIDHIDLIAFNLNGDCSEMFALFPLPEFDPNAKLAFFGDGGEIYRGYYYPNFDSTLSPQPDMSRADVVQILRKKTKIDLLPWKSSDLKKVLDSRIESTIEKYAGLSDNGNDILDMLYLYERTSVWGTRRAGQTWNLHYRRPFESGKLAKFAYRMPAPIAKFATLQRESIRRFTPKIYGIRINGKTKLPFEREGLLPGLLRNVDSRYTHVVNRFKRRYKRVLSRVRPGHQTRDYNQIGIEALGGPLLGQARDILLSDGNFTQEIFDRKSTELILEDIKLQKRRYASPVISLLTVERWSNMIKAVAREAAQKKYSSEIKISSNATR